MPPEPHGAAQPGRLDGEAQRGEPAGRGLTGPGSPAVTLGHLLTAKEGKRAREAARPAGRAIRRQRQIRPTGRKKSGPASPPEWRAGRAGGWVC
jgi:hypothetical protein